MKSFWEFTLDNEEIKTPKKIIESQSEYLESLSMHKFKIEVRDYKMLCGENTMRSQVNLTDKNNSNYAFNLFTYEHNTEMFPVTIKLNPDVKIEKDINLIDLDFDAFSSALKVILNSMRVMNIMT